MRINPTISIITIYIVILEVLAQGMKLWKNYRISNFRLSVTRKINKSSPSNKLL